MISGGMLLVVGGAEVVERKMDELFLEARSLFNNTVDETARKRATIFLKTPQNTGSQHPYP